MKVPYLFSTDVKLLDQISELFSLLPTVVKLPYYNTKVAANIKHLHTLKLELHSQQDNTYREDLSIIAKRIADKLMTSGCVIF